MLLYLYVTVSHLIRIKDIIIVGQHVTTQKYIMHFRTDISHMGSIEEQERINKGAQDINKESIKEQ